MLVEVMKSPPAAEAAKGLCASVVKPDDLVLTPKLLQIALLIFR
jgi:hypothetical protein